MRTFRRALSKTISIQLNLGVLLLIISVPLLKAQELDSLTTITTPDTIRYGNLTVRMKDQLDSLYVVVNKKFEEPIHIKNSGIIRLPEGKYNITIVSRNTQDISFPAKIDGGKNQTVRIPVGMLKNRKEYLKYSSYPVLRKGINVEILTDIDSRVIINDSTYGYGNTRLLLNAGTYRIVTLQPGIGQKVREIQLKSDAPRYHKLLMYNKPSVWVVRVTSFLPGGSQFVKKDMVKADLLLVGLAAGALAGIHYNKLFVERKGAYEAAYKAYQNSITEKGALQLGNQTDKLYSQAKVAQRNRSIVVGSVAALYLYNLLDAWLNTPKGGYRNTDNRSARLLGYVGPNTVGLQFSIPF